MQTEDRQTQIVQQQQQQKESTMETASAVGGGHGRYGKDNKKHTNEGIRKDDVYKKEPVEMEQMRSRTKTMMTTTTLMLMMTAKTVATRKKDQEGWADETKQSAVCLVPKSLPGSKGKKPKTTHAQKTASADPLVSRGGRHQAVRLVPQSLPGSKGNHPQTTHAHMTASADPLVSKGGSHPAVHLVPQRSRFKCIMQELLEASQPHDRLATFLMEFGYLGMDRCIMITKVLLYTRNRLREDIRNLITPFSKMKLEEQV
jgi:hypothetical protein